MGRVACDADAEPVDEREQLAARVLARVTEALQRGIGAARHAISQFAASCTLTQLAGVAEWL